MFSEPPYCACTSRPWKWVSITTLSTPATASEPYSAEAPPISTSICRTPHSGMAFMLPVCRGTRASVWVPGCGTMRRPLTSSRVLPVPRLRRLMEPMSPRAALRLAAVSVLSNIMSPTCGRLRRSSSPETAPVASISSTSITSTGTIPASLLPAKRLPTTTTWSSSEMRSAACWPAGCGCAASSAGGTSGSAGCGVCAKAGAPARIAPTTAASTVLRYVFMCVRSHESFDFLS